MLINDVCRRTGLTRKAIRYYVQQRLVQPAALPNGYLDFSDVQLERLERIAVLRQLGLSVSDIRMALDGGATALRSIAAHRQLDAHARRQRDAILSRLAGDADYAAAAHALQALERRTTIAEKLLEAFPGWFGRFLCVHFGAFLNDELVTDEQRAAYAEVIAFLDGAPDMPQEVIDHFDRLDEQSFDASYEAQQAANNALLTVAQSPERYLTENADMIAQYMEYIRSPEYLNSNEYRIKRAFDEFCRTGGYYDVFLPALARLSPSYAQYRRALERADAILSTRLGK